jgi:hypothetical protein
MKKIKINIWDIVYWTALLIADGMIYLFLGILMMGYDDSYDVSKGAYWSWKSMNGYERMIDSAFIIWNIINLAVLARIIYKIWKWIKTIRAEW